MKTLFVTDLDGTLLGSDQKVSAYTQETINAMIDRGLLFTYATARSHVTASRVSKGMATRIPLIVYNGTFIVDNETETVMESSYFEGGVGNLLDELLEKEIYPIVYAVVDGKELFTYIDDACTDGMREFVDSRQNDPRKRPVSEIDKLYEGKAFYVTCMDRAEKIEPIYQKYKDVYHCVYHCDLYTKAWCLEMMPKQASKASAILWLKAHLCCDRVVVFGDGNNDADMFRVADISCAPENAVDELKAIATHVIASNNDDGVARWLDAFIKEEKEARE